MPSTPRQQSLTPRARTPMATLAAAVLATTTLVVGSTGTASATRTATGPATAFTPTLAPTVLPGPAAKRRGSLQVRPRVYVGGQRMTFTGKLARPGRNRIHLEFNMGRPGDSWTPVAGSGTRTRSGGGFRFTHPAPAMFNVRYRVATRGQATPAYNFRAKSQESLLTTQPARPRAGRAFTVRVDTAPRVGQRTDLPPPAFPGRTVRLQQRVAGAGWQTVASDKSDRAGIATFRVTRNQPGRVTYRARQSDWTRRGNKIGWHPSFPTDVQVVGGSGRAVAGSTAPSTATEVSGPVVPDPVAFRSAGSTNASQRYGWRPALWDFAWERGESLTSAPSRGSRLRGGWKDTSTGSGRASHYNGGLLLDSQFGNRGGPGDHGTTTATLTGNAQTYGRWEFRTRSWSLENNSRDYRIKVQLVPENPADRQCGARDITVADLAEHSSQLRLGVNSLRANRSWTQTRRNVRLGDGAHNVAVEIGRAHISWFLDGAIIATVRNASAVSGVAMTPKVSLQGDDQREMNRTKVIFDWVRSWTSASGKHPRNGRALSAGALRRSC